MNIDRGAFFSSVRVSFGRLKQTQVDGFNNILDEWERRDEGDKRKLAYMLATVWHETAREMQPITERGSKGYLESKRYYPWIGRGLVQITWKDNYQKFGITRPEDALSWPVALRVMFDGMNKGMFTGKKLSDYFSDKKDDPVQARKIINGLDCAALIAGHHRKFLNAVRFIEGEAPPPPDIEPPPAPTQPKGWLTRILKGWLR